MPARLSAMTRGQIQMAEASGTQRSRLFLVSLHQVSQSQARSVSKRWFFPAPGEHSAISGYNKLKKMVVAASGAPSLTVAF